MYADGDLGAYGPSRLILEATKTMTKREQTNYTTCDADPLIFLQFSPDHKGSLSVIVRRHFLDIADGLEPLERIAIFCQYDIDLQPISDL